MADFEHILTTGGAVTMAAMMNGDVQFVSTAASDVLVARARLIDHSYKAVRVAQSVIGRLHNLDVLGLGNDQRGWLDNRVTHHVRELRGRPAGRG